MEHLYSVNMHCAACKGNIEATLKKIDGVLEVNANLVTNVIKVRFNESKVNDEKIIDEVKKVGYRCELIEDDIELNINSSSYKNSLIKLIVGSILLIILMYFSMGDMWPNAIPNFLKSPIYLLPTIELVLTLVIIGIYFSYYKNGFLSLIKLSPNMDSLIFLGSFFSLIYSVYLLIKLYINPDMYYIFMDAGSIDGKMMFHNYFDSAAMILVIVSIGKFIEDLSKRKAKSTINELLKLRPKYANLLQNDEIIKVETKFLKSGDKIIVKEGETIPLDGVIVNGVTSVDESLLTGESLPIYKEEGSQVIGGSINKDGAVTILINKTKKDNVLNKIISLVMEASNMDTKLTRKVDKVSRVFVPIVLGLSVLTFLIWLTIDLVNGSVTYGHHFSSIFDECFTFAVSVLVISCPCALGLATPISLLVGSSLFAKRGILVNKSEAIENEKYIDTIVLDKTNTITNGKLSVSEKIICCDKKHLDRIRTIEQFSTHPLGEGIVAALKDETEIDKTFTMVSNIPGKGVKGIYKDETIFIGNLKLFDEKYVGEDKEKILKEIEEKSSLGLLAILAFTKNQFFAEFYLKDELKENAREFVSIIKTKYKRVILLTGDNSIIANNIAKEVGISEVISDVKPVDKGEIIKKLQDEGHKVMMVGDGVNDSIALTRSDVGVGLAKGSDVALASSDFILMNSNIMDIIDIIDISKSIRRNITFNLLWAFIYNLVFVPIAAGAFSALGLMLSPMYASIAMALSSVTVCLNSLLLFVFNKKRK